MSLSIEQLEIKASTENEMGLNECAFDTMCIMIQSLDKKGLSNSQKTLFENICKDRIQRYRDILGESFENLDLPEQSREIFPFLRSSLILKMQEVILPGINLINGFLLSNAEDEDSKVFYNRVLADFHRYLSECYEPDDQNCVKYLDEANKNYENAINAAKHLSPCNISYLQIIINASIFHTDYLNDIACGIKLAEEGLAKYYAADQDRTEEIPEDQMEIEMGLVERLRSNVEKWKQEIENNQE